MSEALEMLARLRDPTPRMFDGVRVEAANFIERLLRERDEARSFAAHYVKSLTDEAEARGYRRGVEDAAKVAQYWLSDDSYCEKAILALLEQTNEANAMRKK